MSVQTHSQTTRDLRLAAREGLLPARGRGWLGGFNNMLAKELGEWFHTRRWLWQLVIWLIIINGAVAAALFILPKVQTVGLDPMAMVPAEARGLYWYFPMAILGGILGVIILVQDEIIQEKQSGTAAWILSKPVARQAFILTKLASNLIGALVFIVLIPGIVALGETFLATRQMPPLAPFLVGVGVTVLALFFYISLVILLGVQFESRGPVAGIAFGIMFAGRFIAGFIPPLAYVLPVSMDGIAQMAILEVPFPALAISQVISTAVLGILFVVLALWRFQRKEL